MLFKNSDSLKQYAQLTAPDFNALKATIQSVEDMHIIPILGPSMYEALNEAFDETASEDYLSTPMFLLLEQCRKIVGPYVCVYHAPKADIQLSEGGMRRSETNTSKTAYQYQGKKFIEANRAEGDAAIENLIQFLELRKEDYPAWTNSDSYTAYRSLYIKTGTEFNTLFTTQNPYRIFWAIRSKMVDVEENQIRRFLGDTLFDDLKEKDTTAAVLSDEEKALLFKIKKAIAPLTLAFAIPFLNVQIGSNGLSIVSTGTFTTNDDTTSRAAATNADINLYIKRAEATGQQWLKNAADYLKLNKTIFTTWPGNIKPACSTKISESSNTYGLI